MIWLAIIAICIIIGNFIGIYFKNVANRKDYKSMIHNHREMFHKNHKDKK